MKNNLVISITKMNQVIYSRRNTLCRLRSRNALIFSHAPRLTLATEKERITRKGKKKSRYVVSKDKSQDFTIKCKWRNTTPNIRIQIILYTCTFCANEDIPSVYDKLRFARNYGRSGWMPRNFLTKQPTLIEGSLSPGGKYGNQCLCFHHVLDLVMFLVLFRLTALVSSQWWICVPKC